MELTESQKATVRDFAACDFIQVCAWALHFQSELAAEWAFKEAMECLMHGGWPLEAASELIKSRIKALRLSFYEPLEPQFAGVHILCYWDNVAISVQGWEEEVWQQIRREIVDFNAQFVR